MTPMSGKYLSTRFFGKHEIYSFEFGESIENRTVVRIGRFGLSPDLINFWMISVLYGLETQIFV